MGGCARPIRGARVNATKRPIRGRELIKVRHLFKEIRYDAYDSAKTRSSIEISVCRPAFTSGLVCFGRRNHASVNAH